MQMQMLWTKSKDLNLQIETFLNTFDTFELVHLEWLFFLIPHNSERRRARTSPLTVVLAPR